jgi:hypothetical protein
MSVKFEPGQRVRMPGSVSFMTIDDARSVGNGWRLYLTNDGGDIQRVDLTPEPTHAVEILDQDGTADSAKVLATLWARLRSHVVRIHRDLHLHRRKPANAS